MLDMYNRCMIDTGSIRTKGNTMRKTVRLADVAEKVNARNRKSTCSAEVRDGWNSVLEDMLMEADAYLGFQYLEAEDVPDGHLPGIVRDGNGAAEYPDGSRVRYIISSSLS